MDEISKELLEEARKVLKNKSEKSSFSDVDYLKYKLHIGMIKAGQIIELLQGVDK